jgi:hypothetical protein
VLDIKTKGVYTSKQRNNYKLGKRRHTMTTYFKASIQDANNAVRPTTDIEVDVEIVREGYAELVSDDTGVWIDVHYDVELFVSDYGYNYDTEDSEYELSDDEKDLAREQAYTYYWENYRHV